MAVTQYAEIDGVTVGTSPISVITGTTTITAQTTPGVFQLFVDAGNMAKGDEFRIKGLEKVEATGGTVKTFFSFSLLGVQAEIFVTPAFMLMNGWSFTIEKIAGTDRAFDATIRQG